MSAIFTWEQQVNNKLDGLRIWIINQQKEIDKLKQDMKQHYSIRVEKELLDKIKKAAKVNDRSVNGEIRHLLKKGLEK